MRNSDTKEIILIGARMDGHAGVVINSLKLLNNYKVIGFIDRTRELQGKKVNGIPVIGSTEELDMLNLQDKNLHISIGDNAARKVIYKKLKMIGANVETIIHPTAIISADVKIGEGCYIGPGAIINNATNIGCVCIINSGSIIEHDNDVGNAVHIAPGTTTAGRVKIEELAFVGLGSKILPDIKIGSGVMVGAGSTVVRDVPPQETIIGYAAKKIKKNIYASMSENNEINKNAK